jgi:hypothetical protein
MMRCVQQTRKGNAAVQGMHLVAGQRCTPFAESFRGLTATSYRTAQRTSLTLEPFTMLHVRPLQNGRDTVEDGLARLFERSVDDSQQPGSHQTLILELPKVRCSDPLLCAGPSANKNTAQIHDMELLNVVSQVSCEVAAAFGMECLQHAQWRAKCSRAFSRVMYRCRFS